MTSRLALICLFVVSAAACGSTGLVPGGSLDADGGTKRAGADLALACDDATDRASCEAIAGCEPITCPTCDGSSSYNGCAPTGQSFGCPAGCGFVAPPIPCAQLTDAASCNARTDCYALNSGDSMCNSLGCNNPFLSCNDGTSVACTGTGTHICNCPAEPTCVDGDVPAYQDGGCCSSHCVAATKCTDAP